MNKYRILIADDDPIARKIYQNFLDTEEFELIFAKNGMEAIEIVKSGEKIDLVLLDLNMPEIDGFVTGGLIKMFLPKVPIIAQSAYIEEIVKNRIDRKVFKEFLNKPIIKEELFSILDKYLHIYA